MRSNRNMVLLLVIAILVIAGIIIFVMLRNNDQAIESAGQNANNSMAANNMNMSANNAANRNAASNTNTQLPANNSNSGNSNANNSNTNTQPSVKTFNVTGENFSFSPAQITVNKGDTVKIIFTSKGNAHDWVIDQFNAKTPVTANGQTSEVQFIADKTGTFQYYCSVGNHRQMGMVGTLTVK